MPTLLLPLLKPCRPTAPERHNNHQQQNKFFERYNNVQHEEPDKVKVITDYQTCRSRRNSRYTLKFTMAALAYKKKLSIADTVSINGIEVHCRNQ